MYSCICASTDHCNLNQCKAGTHCVHYSYYVRLWWTRRNLVGCFIDVRSSVTWQGTQCDCVALRLPICAACIQVPSDSNFINLLLASDKCTQRCRTSWQIMPVRKWMVFEKFIAGSIIPGVLFHIRMLFKKCSGCNKGEAWWWNKQHCCFAFGRFLFHVLS